ncbi:MAG: thioredoxin domain-containing protein [Candidatus Aenigmatarchaeota archaeon]|nr:MAG: thioredoxin domain-containing protein [Candidatus Aenigmarchaeota archaeon]
MAAEHNAIVIPHGTVKWAAVFLIGLSAFSFLLGVIFSPALVSGGVADSVAAGSGDSRVKVTDVDAASMGSADAKVRIIEYSDFQCPFCRKFVEDTLPQLEAEYIDTGKVEFEYRHFPLSFHPGARPAAEAAECAREQGKFWEVHDIIFEKQAEQGAGTIDLKEEDIKLWLSEVEGLDAARVVQCMDNDDKESLILRDLADGGKYDVGGTPTFFVGTDQKGYVPLVGAQPFEAFQPIIDEELK